MGLFQLFNRVLLIMITIKISVTVMEFAHAFGQGHLMKKVLINQGKKIGGECLAPKFLPPFYSYLNQGETEAYVTTILIIQFVMGLCSF